MPQVHPPLPPLPRYRCHKVVEAALIGKITLGPTILHLETGQTGATVKVSVEYLRKHQPEVGGYYVRYEDGYESYSPAAAFEAGYTRLTGEG